PVVEAPAVGEDHVAPASVAVRYSYPETPFSASVEPPAAIARKATFCQVSAPPDTTGVVGAERSMCTVLLAPTTAGAHVEGLPERSSARNCTTVSPSADTASDAPAVGLSQVVPPSVDVRYSYPATPEPPSVEPEADTVTEAT